MNENVLKSDINHINSENALYTLINRVHNGCNFADKFTFEPVIYRDQFLLALRIEIDKFNQKHFFYDADSNLHISDSDEGYLWISTMGLIAKGKLTDNPYVNSCSTQYETLSLLLDKSIDLCKDETVYYVDSYSHEYLCKITPALFHNFSFYLETFGKAYLSLNKVTVPKVHKLYDIFILVKQTMNNSNKNNTMFHALILNPIDEFINVYVNDILGNFKEQNIKYDDNSGDSTVISFKYSHIVVLRELVALSYDFIMCYYYEKDNTHYLEQGFFEKMLINAKTDEDKKRITETYRFLLEKT